MAQIRLHSCPIVGIVLLTLNVIIEAVYATSIHLSSPWLMTPHLAWHSLGIVATCLNPFFGGLYLNISLKRNLFVHFAAAIVTGYFLYCSICHFVQVWEFKKIMARAARPSKEHRRLLVEIEDH